MIANESLINLKLAKMRDMKARVTAAPAAEPKPLLTPAPPQPPPPTSPDDPRLLSPQCDWRRDFVGMTRCHCAGGGRGKSIPSYGCAVFGKCTADPEQIARDVNIKTCRHCPPEVRKPSLTVVDPVKKCRWSYGVTTVPSRRLTTLPGTLTSLAKAGFDDPVLFVDGGSLREWAECQYRVTVRSASPAKALGNWWLTAHELYANEPTADYYAIFQDDVMFVKNLRRYIELVRWPGPGYLNLYTFPENHALPQATDGFFRSNQKGKGALALVFRREDFIKVLKADHMIEKFVPKPNSFRWFKAVDGGVVDSVRQSGGSEWVHGPSLCQHTGQLASTLGNVNPQSPSFPGEQQDALEFLK